jgi:hypothetical protein
MDKKVIEEKRKMMKIKIKKEKKLKFRKIVMKKKRIQNYLNRLKQNNLRLLVLHKN